MKKFNLNGMRPCGYPTDVTNSRNQVIELILNKINVFYTEIERINNLIPSIQQKIQAAQNISNNYDPEVFDPDTGEWDKITTSIQAENPDSILNQMENLVKAYEGVLSIYQNALDIYSNQIQQFNSIQNQLSNLIFIARGKLDG